MKPKRIIFAIVMVLLLIGSVWWLAMNDYLVPKDHSDPSSEMTSLHQMNRLEQWTRDQLLKITNDLIKPKLAFSSLKLELPATGTFTDVTLRSGDLTIIEMTSMTLVFKELPRQGQPLVIESATFVNPSVKLIGRPEGGLEGFTGFIKSFEGQTYDDGGSSKPSEVFAIRRIAIVEGKFEWSQSGYEHPLILEQLTMDLSTSPDTEKPGWYGFNATIKREPIMTLTWDGGINIDTGDLDFNDTSLVIDLEADKYSSLTPQIQDFLAKYQIVGELTLHTTGRVPITHAQDTDLVFNATLTDSNAAIGEYQFPIDKADLNATFKDMRFSFAPLHVMAFRGMIETSGYFDFNDAKPFQMDVKANDVLIQDLLRTTSSEEPRFSGKIDLTLNAEGEGDEASPSIKGTGELHITEGHLINIKVFGAIANALHITDDKKRKAVDTGMARFTLKNDRVTIDKAEIESAASAAKGKGDIFYDGRLDLLLNAGTLEKVNSLLGAIGDLFSVLTDRLLPFRVTGTLKEPVVTPEPLSLPLGKLRDGGH